MIAPVEGRVHMHSEYALLANVIVASEGATFHDLPHRGGTSLRGQAPQHTSDVTEHRKWWKSRRDPH